MDIKELLYMCLDEMLKFCEKVESGEARSVNTYKRFIEILKLAGIR